MSFVDEVMTWVNKAEERTTLTAKFAVIRVGEEANKVGAMSGQPGGGMRWRTGFLHDSLAAQEGAPPSGPSVNPHDHKGVGDPHGNPDISPKVMSWTFKSPMIVGWTASYAVKREDIDTFMGHQVDDWTYHVGMALSKAQQEVP